MSEKEKEELEESLTGYKQKINHVSKATVTWGKELIFLGETQEGYEIEFDAHVQWGCKPTDALLLSLAGCMGIDVIMFLQKMKHWVKQWLFFANSVRYASAMTGALGYAMFKNGWWEMTNNIAEMKEMIDLKTSVNKNKTTK